ncbi:MAG: ATP-binding protein [Saprospiraceae bacterium]|nr:ATP-binding protein [Saprospiraceae bacterium]MBK8296358.1 ATP-binding protein [Saprospiraceae bacterium]
MPYKIVVTGPESCGKTSLCNYLSSTYKGKLIPEYSRVYLAKNPEYPDKMALEYMGIQQENLNNLASESCPLVFCDTDSLNYLIWTQEIYGKSSNSLELLFSKNKASLYLLCCPDIPWVYDPLRQNPTDRDRLFKLYWQFLQSKHLPICFVSGIGIQRFKKACFFIENHIPEIRNFKR